MKLLKSQRGFTLIELMVIMVILGIISMIGIGSVRSSQLKARDARRKSDLRQIGSALETYYNDYGQYPTSTGGNIAACGGVCSWGDTFTDVNGTLYMTELPADPSSDHSYVYEADASGTYYQLYARLENIEDSAIAVDSEDNPQVYQGVDCAVADCNYGISSSNVTPEQGRVLADDES